MIRTLFLPEQIDFYYPLPKRIVGIVIGQYGIQAVHATLSGKTITIDALAEEHIAQSGEEIYQKRVGTALQELLKRIGPYDELRTALVSSQIMFKELTVPFISREQIDLVIRYEVESFLPFSVNDAILDFIIIEQNLEKQTSTVMIAAVQKKYIIEHLALFQQAGIEPDTITVDMFDIYALYKFIHSEPAAATTAIIAIDLQTTQIAYLVENKLRQIRVLSEGLLSLARKLSQKTGSSQAQAYEDLIRFGMINTENASYTEASNNLMQQFVQSIKFTLDTFSQQQQTSHENLTVIVCGQATLVPDFIETFGSMIGYRCIPFTSVMTEPKILQEKGIIIPNTMIGAVATALPLPLIHDVNLRKDEFAPKTTVALLTQLGIAGLLCLGILGLLFFNTYRQTSALNRIKQSLNREVINYLNEQNLIEGQTSVQEALDAATEKINQEEEIWFAFSSQTRFSMLKHLQALSAAIDRESTQLNLERLEITEKTISIKGSVPSYEKLKVLERELSKSDLFVSVPALQELKFDETLIVKNKNGAA